MSKRIQRILVAVATTQWLKAAIVDDARLLDVAEGEQTMETPQTTGTSIYLPFRAKTNSMA